MKLRFRRAAMPDPLRAALQPDEQIAAAVHTDSGITLAASRFGLWIVTDAIAERIDWHHVSKARFADGVLHLTVADEVGTWPGGAVLLRDRAPRTWRPDHANKLTDAVHRRVRDSVVASRHLPWPGAGGWVVLRKVAGRNGLTVQVRLDPGSDLSAPGFDEAVVAVVDSMWPEQVPRGREHTDHEE